MNKVMWWSEEDAPGEIPSSVLPPSHTVYLCSEEIHGTYRLKICTNDKSLRVECLAYIHDGFDILECLLLLPNHHSILGLWSKLERWDNKLITIALSQITYE